MSNKSQRLTWRTRCRRWRRQINALLACAALIVLLAPAVPAQAQTTIRCTRPAVPMFYHVTRPNGEKITVGVCRTPRYIRGVLP
jgi:hypothetical protein